jgi:hypothetical protein
MSANQIPLVARYTTPDKAAIEKRIEELTKT